MRQALILGLCALALAVQPALSAEGLPLTGEIVASYGAPAAPVAGRPRPDLTPGAVRSSNLLEVCPTGTEQFRTLSTREKRRIARSYGLPNRAGYTMDHLVPLGVGGADLPSNIWPETHDGALRKDRCERAARRLVCSGRLAIGDAQRGFSNDYVAFCASIRAPVE